MINPRYWRIRIKYGGQGELTREAWERNEVGIWYGAWTVQELKQALKTNAPLRHLSRANKVGGLKWDMTPKFLALVKRFIGIEEGDWVIVYFEGVLGLARVASRLRSSASHPLNRNGEVFHYRKITRKKTFSLNRLPDAYRVLRSAGRGNVYQLRRGAELASLLGRSSSPADVTRKLKTKPLHDALELLGPTTWESLCEAYLTIEHGFVPTGLATGRTLAGVDIVGRRMRDGARILAQCKKDPRSGGIADGFLEAIADLGKNGIAFYFAYGGCDEQVPRGVEVVDREAILQWSKTARGAKYFNWLFGA